MFKNKKNVFTKLVLILALGFASHIALGATAYSIQTLEPLGGSSTKALGINNLGQVAGRSQGADGNDYATYWDQNGVTVIGSSGTEAVAINNYGQVVVSATIGSGVAQAYVWQDGVQTPYQSPSPDVKVALTDINNSGQVVGYLCEYGDCFGRLWDGPDSSSSTNTLVQNINNLGEIVGANSSYVEGKYYDPSSGQGIAVQAGKGVDINNNGIGAFKGFQGDDALLWDSHTGGMVVLPYRFSPEALNDQEEVVGAFWGTDQSGASFWSDETGMLLLWDLVIDKGEWESLTVATHINEIGQIVGYGMTADGRQQAFLLTPAEVPLPSTLFLFASSLLGLRIAKRNRLLI